MSSLETTDDAEDVGQARASPVPSSEDGGTPVIHLSQSERRSIALNGLFAIAVLIGLNLAATLLIPIVVAFLLSILLAPSVAFLSRNGLPTPYGAALVVGGVVVTVCAGILVLSDPAQRWFERIPQNFFRIEEKLRPMKEPIAELAKAGKKIQEATRLDTEKPLEVTIEPPGVTEQFLSGTYEIIASIGIVILLLYFLLASGDTFLRKLVEMTPTLKDKKRSVEITRSIQSDISFYLASMTAINSTIGLLVAFYCWWIGIADPILWGVIVAILSFAPYAGSTVIAVMLGFVGLLTFNDWFTALSPAAVYLVLMFIAGNGIVPFLLGRQLTLSPIAIFLAIIFWWWMWGVIGALVAVPLLATLKVICQRVDSLRPVANFLTP